MTDSNVLCKRTVNSRRLLHALGLSVLFVLWAAVVRIGEAQGSEQAAWAPYQFGSWPTSFGVVSGSPRTIFSMYGTYDDPLPTPTSDSKLETVGYTTIGTDVDSADSGSMNGSRFVTGPIAGHLKSLSVYVAAPVESAPNDQFELAVFADAGGNPGPLIATSVRGVLTADSWNTAAIDVSLSPTTAYWLMFNTNGSSDNVNNMRYSPVVANPLDAVIRTPQAEWLFPIASNVTMLGDPQIVLVPVLALALWLGKRHSFLLGAMVVVGFGLTLVVETAVKDVLFYPYESFPSGHALRTVYLAILVAGLVRRRSVVLAAAALSVFVCLGAVYTGHHSSDEILGGVLASWAIALTVLAFSPLVMQGSSTPGGHLRRWVRTQPAAAPRRG